MRVNPVDPIAKIYKEHERLVAKCLRGFKVPKLCEFEDLEQVGRMGLIEAIKRYDPTRGCEFSTYAWYYIRGAILRFIKQNRCLLHLPANSDNDFINTTVVSSLDIGDLQYKVESIEDDRDSIDQDRKLDYYLLKKLFNKYWYELTPRQREVMVLYYYTLDENGRKYTYDSVAKLLGVSRERVRQLLENGRGRLKKIMRKLDVYI